MLPSPRTEARSARQLPVARPLIVLLLIPLAAPASAEELVLAVPAQAVQDVLDRASPLRGRTPDGIAYTIEDPIVRITGGRILTNMDVTLSGSVVLLGQEITLGLQGSLEGEIVARVDRERGVVRGGMVIHRLQVDGLERISDAQEIKDVIGAGLSFQYPLDLPSSLVPELGVVLGGSVTRIELAEGRLLLYCRVAVE